MSDWTISVETPEGTTRDEDALVNFDDALQADATVAGPAASLNTERGTLAATFTVDADSRDDAALAGCRAYWRAIAAAGLELHDLSAVDVDAAADDQPAERFRFLLEREGPVRA